MLLSISAKEELTIEEIKAGLVNMCGGLLEIDPYEWGSAYVQFIHQTSKDYVGRPEVLNRLLGRSNVSQLGNGYEFWLKYEFARLEAKSYMRLDDPLNLMGLAHNAEYSPGRDLSIDTVPRAFWNAVSARSCLTD
jgi:hypothetical protein